MAMLGLPKLWKPISAFLYSRLLTWADAIEEGLNPPRSFNLVSAARNRPSGDPNCELFPQVTIIPVPPSTPPYRPVGAYGNNRAVFPGRNAKKASEPEGPEAVVPVISLVALPCGDAETASGGTQQHQNTSSEASSRYSHSFALDCRGVIPAGSSLVVGFDRLAAESLRVSSRRCLGQILGQIRKLFRNREPAVSFLSRGQKWIGSEAQFIQIRAPRRSICRIGARSAR